MVLCTSTNETYALGATIALASALRRIPVQREPVRIYVLDGGVRARTWQRLARSLELTECPHELVRLHPDMEPFAGFPKDWGSSVMAYARLALPSLVDEPRVLYIDADVVVQVDLSVAWKIDLGDRIIGAARDPIVENMGNEALPLEQLGLPYDAPYFQSGVLLIDMVRWRAEDVSERALNYLRMWPKHAKHWDQSALNVVLFGQWKEMAAEWNLPAWWAEEGRSKSEVKGAVLHFIGPNKPWLRGHHEGAAADQFYAEVDCTAWRNWRPTAWRQALKWAKYQAGRMIHH